ncbi:2Fe-2S iron-sulfur cluster-binding protein [Hansschlegelia zhihuaiae]|uniref:2Fe-2S iron-sulfur cluster binding domain-containing protein n=1 Tax=Hansschlegelia zhihuaiae TaxID=405005 RepID=A0A4Q0MDT3_9HYPH|nr:2Fe-2S iron-sulfur cluster binding domain-containing protein [Hansschlegelia zhihuaiae]RXF70966.1 2Fe-2S iron-sulfur cluster binding domain-containing protein [Hansschlegelia zhihuaiae]
MIEVTVEDRAGGRTRFAARPGERLLHAGLAAGLGLPYECATGTCGSCRATVTEGDVGSLWADAPGRRVCRRPGEILMCQSAAAGGALSLKLPTAFRDRREPECRSLSGRLSSFRRFTAEIGTFSVELDEPVEHLPGQFALISAPGVEGPRAYSMTGNPSTEPRLDFLARLSGPGKLTPRLFSNALEGREVEVFGPLGRAALRPEDDRPFVAIAGGSGVAGMLSIVEAALARGHFDRHPSRLVFGLRSMEGSYLLDRLSEFVRLSGGLFRTTVAFSDEAPDPEFEAIFPDLEFTTGYVHDVVRSGLSSISADRPICFVAGPPPMVDATMRMLVVEGKVSPAEIRFDRFG